MPSSEHEDIVAMMGGGLALQELSLMEQRAMMNASASMFPTAPGLRTESVDADGVPADWLTFEASARDRAILYLHGGAYVTGSRDSHRGLASRVALAAGAPVLLAEYRLAPEAPFPAAVEDAVTSWRWLLQQGVPARSMAIAGDSAGGGLALATLLALKDAGLPQPGCAVALSPWTDLAARGPTAVPGAVDDPMLTLAGLTESAAHYAPGDLLNPLASPLHGDLRGLPPLLLQVGTREILLSDSTRFARRAEAAGVDVTLDVEEGLIHVWQSFPDLPESRRSLERIGAFVRDRCAPPRA